MTNTEARIRELNHCKKLLVAEQKRCTTYTPGVPVPYGTHVYGLRRAVQLLMERKQELRAEVVQARVRSQGGPA